MSAVCVYGDGPVAASIARTRLAEGDDVALLCRRVDAFALLASEFHDAFLPIEVGNPGNANLDQARELIQASFGPVHELVIVVPPEPHETPPADVRAATEAFTAHLRSTSGSLVLIDERAADHPGAVEGRRYLAQLGESEPAIITVLRQQTSSLGA